MRFTWRASKAALNFRKHGVRFEEAQTVFEHETLDRRDDAHSVTEVRCQTLGPSSAGRLLMVVWTDRTTDAEEVIHLISARKATPVERRKYRTHTAR